jgi:hypothetical protein
MILPPWLRKLTLTAHVAASVGWLGAVAAFLALALGGLLHPDPQRVRAAYLVMDWVGWWVIVPASVASLLTGLVQSLGTRWGLFRHYWVLIKLGINVFCTVLLLVHMQPIGQMAQAAAHMELSGDTLWDLRIQILLDAAAALLALLVATALSVIKPQGLTPYGLKVSSAARTDPAARSR